MTEGLGFTDYISSILHIVSQALLIPVMVILVLLIVFALYCLGSILAEFFTERRYFKANIPLTINQIHDAAYEDVEAIVDKAQLLLPQKQALLMVVRNMGLSDDDLFALAKTQIAKVDDRYKKILSRTEQVIKIAPMMGLMCTLIPLGPGIVAMGEGNVTLLSMSLLIAFDGTVAGLLAAVFSLVISGFRKRWYAQYLIILESLMTCLLDKASTARRSGVQLPHNYSEAFSDINSLLGAIASNPRQKKREEEAQLALLAGEESPDQAAPDQAVPDTPGQAAANQAAAAGRPEADYIVIEAIAPNNSEAAPAAQTLAAQPPVSQAAVPAPAAAPALAAVPAPAAPAVPAPATVVVSQQVAPTVTKES